MRLFVIILHRHGQSCPHWDDATTYKRVDLRGGIHVNQKFIHEKFSRMSDKLRAGVDSEGRLHVTRRIARSVDS